MLWLVGAKNSLSWLATAWSDSSRVAQLHLINCATGQALRPKLDVYLKPLPGKTASETLKAIDQMIVMGSKMDGNLVKAATEAQHTTIGKGATSAPHYKAVNAVLGRLVASVPKSIVMDVYNSTSKIVASSVTNNMFSKVNPLDAVAAAKGFYTFKDVVETAQR